jgi:hypothetical protein
MRSQILLMAAAAALSLPAAASTQAGGDPALEAFRSICWNASGDYGAAVRAADNAGWKDAAVQADSDASVTVTGQSAREKDLGDGADLTLLVTQGLQHTKGGDVKVATCKISMNKADKALMGAGQSWVGAAPDNGSDPTLAVYYVKPGSGSPAHLTQSQLGAALSAGGFGILKFQQDPGASILVYIAYSK